jgi:hypothetical protein
MHKLEQISYIIKTVGSIFTSIFTSSNQEIFLPYFHYTVKGARGKVSFDSQNDKYASQLSCEASPEASLSHVVYQMTNALHSYPE